MEPGSSGRSGGAIPWRRRRTFPRASPRTWWPSPPSTASSPGRRRTTGCGSARAASRSLGGVGGEDVGLPRLLELGVAPPVDLLQRLALGVGEATGEAEARRVRPPLQAVDEGGELLAVGPDQEVDLAPDDEVVALVELGEGVLPGQLGERGDPVAHHEPPGVGGPARPGLLQGVRPLDAAVVDVLDVDRAL